MLFISYEFIFFLLLVFALYYVMPKNWQWQFLLLASYVFYFLTGAENLLFILFTTVTTYLIVRRIQNCKDKQSAYLAEHKIEMTKEERKKYKTKGKRQQKCWLLLCLLFNIGMLAVVKCTGWIFVLGISFYVLQSMGYAIDVYRGKYRAEENPFKLALFVTFFPQLVQGPISRFDDLAKSLFEPHRFCSKTVAFGLQRILWGFFKKVVIADRIAIAVNTIIGETDRYSGSWVFVGMMFYAIQLYADFTGGIDITIGIAQSLGIQVRENFIRPYFSKNIKEYWNRWHITMGSWFKEYVFYPVSVCGPMRKIRKVCGKRAPVYLSCILVWLATGVWHGTGWNFIVWGLANCMVILISQEFDPFYRWFHSKVSVKRTLGFKVFQVARTIFLMSSLRIFDCYREVGLAFRMYGTMFTECNLRQIFSAEILQLGLSVADYIVVLIGVILLIVVSLVQRKGSVREKIATKPYALRFVLWFGLFLIIIIFGNYGIGYDESQFIYHQF